MIGVVTVYWALFALGILLFLIGITVFCIVLWSDESFVQVEPPASAKPVRREEPAKREEPWYRVVEESCTQCTNGYQYTFTNEPWFKIPYGREPASDSFEHWTSKKIRCTACGGSQRLRRTEYLRPQPPQPGKQFWNFAPQDKGLVWQGNGKPFRRFWDGYEWTGWTRPDGTHYSKPELHFNGVHMPDAQVDFGGSPPGYRN